MTSNGKISSLRRKLLLILEEMVGDSCYNGNIQNYGPGGEWESEGRSFRYPITFIGEKGKKIKTSYPRASEITDTMLRNGHYKFGANELHIMYALDQILDALERTYGIDLGGGIEDSQEDSKGIALPIEISPYARGKLAYEQGSGLSENPYHPWQSYEAYYKWFKGWLDAERGVETRS